MAAGRTLYGWLKCGAFASGYPGFNKEAIVSIFLQQSYSIFVMGC